MIHGLVRVQCVVMQHCQNTVAKQMLINVGQCSSQKRYHRDFTFGAGSNLGLKQQANQIIDANAPHLPYSAV